VNADVLHAATRIMPLQGNHVLVANHGMIIEAELI
jgi:hypothetical protein